MGASKQASAVPPSRWNHSVFHDPQPGRPGRTVAPQAGFIDDADLFDPACFGISPREAAYVDPQHRLALEVAWDALEDAGLPLEKIAGSLTGVFMGIASHEYGGQQGLDSMGMHTSTG
jgi:acyl transferase domain-containing protein